MVPGEPLPIQIRILVGPDDVPWPYLDFNSLRCDSKTLESILSKSVAFREVISPFLLPRGGSDPYVAHAVLPFGGFKGYGINLLIEIMTATLVRTKSGLDQPADNQRHIGSFIIVIDPAAFGDIDAFKAATTKLAEDLLAVPPVNPHQPVRVPGFRGGKRQEQFLKDGVIEIEDEGWHKFEAAMSTGE